MLQEVKNFPFLKEIIDNHLIIQQEFLKAREGIKEIKEFFEISTPPSINEDLRRWVHKEGFNLARIGYDIRKEDPYLGLPIYSISKKELYPEYFCETYKIFKKNPYIEDVIFAIMSPNSHLLSHQHYESKGLMIFHMCMFDLDGHASFRVNNDILNYNKEKDHFLFYPYDEHESYNYSNTYRINLLVEFPEKAFQHKIRKVFKYFFKKE